MNNIKDYSHKLYEEMHARPYPSVRLPASVGHILFLNKENQAQITNFIKKVLTHFNIGFDEELKPTKDFIIKNTVVRYAKHSEFSTLTLIFHGEQSSQKIPIEVLETLYDEQIENNILIKATINLLSDYQKEVAPEPLKQDFFPDIEASTLLVGSSVFSKKAQIITPFRQNKDGISQFIVFTKDLKSRSTGRLISTLLEIEDYRILALQGLDKAKYIYQQLDDIDQQLSVLVKKNIHNQQITAQNEILNSLLLIANTVENMRTQTSRRFSATKAYYELVKFRFKSLGEEKLPNFQRLEIFSERRLLPAINTCISAEKQLESLSQRIDRIADLLRTEINLNIEEQNNTLLSTMSQRFEAQLKMQKTVEGISIVAMTYYALGILSYLISGFTEPDTKKLILSLLVLPTGIILWRIQRYVLHKIHK